MRSRDILISSNSSCKGLLEWSDSRVFNADHVVCMAVHNSIKTVRNSILSVLNQISTKHIALLIADDDSTDNWKDCIADLLPNSKVVILSGVFDSVFNVRNNLLEKSKEFFPDAIWFSRLDSDDTLYDENSIENCYKHINRNKGNIYWVLSGNVQNINGKVLEIPNMAIQDLTDDKYLLNRLDDMRILKCEAELCSCNLWLHRDLGLLYPDIASAEDHFLLAFLLINYKKYGLLLDDVIYSNYTLNGDITTSNRCNNLYKDIRTKLMKSAKYWINGSIPKSDKIILGWGCEGIVSYECGRVTKKIYKRDSFNFITSRIDLYKKLDHFYPNISADNRSQTISYDYINTKTVTNISNIKVTEFIKNCYEARVVCHNIAYKNIRVTDNGDLIYIDLGLDINNFKMKYFRDMCARLYQLFILEDDDFTLKVRTHIFRNDETELKCIYGFEDFYRSTLDLIFKDNISSNECPSTKAIYDYLDTTFLIKTCAMDSHLVENQIVHLTNQLGRRHNFQSIIVLVDPKKNNFLRQYRDGNYSYLLDTLERLKSMQIIDEYIIAPNDDNTKIAETYINWYCLDSTKTHTSSNAPLFSQLWAFDNIRTSFLLQVDVDMLVFRSEEWIDYLGPMRSALQESNTISCGLNTAKYIDDPIVSYFAEEGEYAPDIPLCLIDLDKLKSIRPLPNSMDGDLLKLMWHRSIEKFQNETGWKSLRGGDPRTYCIHPENKHKVDKSSYLQIQDLVEQGYFPSTQFNEWNLKGSLTDWSYSHREEDLIVISIGGNQNIIDFERFFTSLKSQTYRSWGAVIIDDASNLQFQKDLLYKVQPLLKNITLIRNSFAKGRLENLIFAIKTICINPHSRIVILDSDDAFFNSEVLTQVSEEFENGADVVLGGMYRPDKPLKIYQRRLYDLRKPDIGNNWAHLLSFAKKLFDKIPEDYFYFNDSYSPYATDMITMLPIVEMANKVVEIDDYLYFYDQKNPKSNANKRIRKDIVSRLLQLDKPMK
ncbi:MAG: glycosyltransferase [Spirochaetaceae bacterium]